MMNYEEINEYLKGHSPVFGEAGLPEDKFYWNLETIEELVRQYRNLAYSIFRYKD